mmetsp:Transcript_114720/g.370890  ORF Transcript_114720/g.370890 Transcript_114720/m.370890 type:complete len:532 (-) Transcript_114720:8-1603(-)
MAAASPIFVVVSLAAAGHVDLVRVGGLHWVNVRDLVDLHAGVVLLECGHIQGRRQEGTDLLLALRREGLREFDRQDQEEVAVHKGVLERRHALILDGFHHPEALLGLGVRQHVHGATLARLLRRQGLLARARLEVGPAFVDDEDAHIDALALELRLASLLERFHIRGVRLSDVVDARAIAVLNLLPIRLRLLAGQGVEALSHRPHDLAGRGLDEQLAAVQVRELDLEAAERLHEGDPALDEEVSALALEVSVLLLLQHEHDISGVCVGVLVGHFPELNLVSIGRALLDVHLQDFPLLLRLEGLAVAAARAALRLHLLDHGAHADDFDLHAAAVAIAALLDTALLVDDLSRDGHLLGGSVVHLLQGGLECLHDVLGLLASASATSAPAAAAAEEGLEDVRGVAATTAPRLQALLAEPIVRRSLLGVAQHLVGPGDLLELLGVAALVRVVLHRELAVGLLELGVIGALLHLQALVKAGGVHRLPTTPASPASTRHAARKTARETARETAAARHAATEEHGCKRGWKTYTLPKN